MKNKNFGFPLMVSVSSFMFAVYFLYLQFAFPSLLIPVIVYPVIFAVFAGFIAYAVRTRKKRSAADFAVLIILSALFIASFTQWMCYGYGANRRGYSLQFIFPCIHKLRISFLGEDAPPAVERYIVYFELPLSLIFAVVFGALNIKENGFGIKTADKIPLKNLKFLLCAFSVALAISVAEMVVGFIGVDPAVLLMLTGAALLAILVAAVYCLVKKDLRKPYMFVILGVLFMIWFASFAGMGHMWLSYWGNRQTSKIVRFIFPCVFKMTSSFYRGGSGPFETHVDYAVSLELIFSVLAFTLTYIKYVRLKKIVVE